MANQNNNVGMVSLLQKKLVEVLKVKGEMQMINHENELDSILLLDL